MTLFLTAPWDDNAHTTMIELELEIRTIDEREHTRKKEREIDRETETD